MPIPKPGPWFETRRGWVRQWGGTTTLWDQDLVDAAWAWVAGREYGYSVYDPEGNVISRNDLRIMVSPEEALRVGMGDCDTVLDLWEARQPSIPSTSVWDRLIQED